MNPSAQAMLLQDLGGSIEEAGGPKLLVGNGHGGNDFRQMIRELQAGTGVFLCTTNWWTLGEADRIFDEPGDHAGELETSVMMHLHPDAVRPLTEAGDGHEKKFKIEGFRKRRVWAPRFWSQVSEDTGVGNPAKSTADKGRVFLEDVTDELAAFLVELDAADVEDLYA